MNHKITALAVMTFFVGMFTSCINSDDEDSITYDDTLITSFVLGNVKRTYAPTDSTTSTYTYSASTYAMSIDQINHAIFNLDSLIAGTDVSKVLTTVTTKNNGIVYILDTDGESWTYYDSSDSIDYTSPRTFRVISDDDSSFRDYTVTVNIHKEYADSFKWDAVKVGTLPAVYRSLSAAVLCSDGSIVTMLTGGTSGNALYSSNDYTTWNSKSLASSNAADSTIVYANGKLYMTAGGHLSASADGTSWSSCNDDVTVKTLCGGNDSCLYVINSDNNIIAIKKNGSVVPDSIENFEYGDVKASLPTKDVTFSSLKMSSDTCLSRFILVGNTTAVADTNAVIWNRVNDPDLAQPWMLNAFQWDNHYYTLANMQGLSAVYYGDGMLAMGGASTNANAKTPYSTLYYSPDFGASWHIDSTISLPKDYTTDGVSAAKILTDGKSLYIVVLVNNDGQNSQIKMWKGHQNKQNWATTKYYYR